MWKKFIQGLGKIVQGLFKKNKKSEPSLMGASVSLSPGGEVFVNGVSFGRVEAVETLSLDEFNEMTNEDIGKMMNVPGECVFEVNLADEEVELLKKLANTSKQVLPKRYCIPTLIVSIYANHDAEYIGTDWSQYEEHGIVHYFATTTRSMEEMAEQFSLEEEDVEDEEHIVIENGTLWEITEGNYIWYGE